MEDMHFSLVVQPETISLSLLSVTPAASTIFFALALNQRFTPAPVSFVRLQELTDMPLRFVQGGISELVKARLVKAFKPAVFE
jgi:hypothetical protein